MFRWTDLAPLCGDADLSAPAWLAWDERNALLALGYESFVAVLASAPHLALASTLPLRNSSGGVWSGGRLCVCDPERVSVATIDEKGAAAETRSLATAVGSPASVHAGGLVSLPERMRPMGQLNPVAADGNHLWLADTRLRLTPIGLDPNHRDLRVAQPAAAAAAR